MIAQISLGISEAIFAYCTEVRMGGVNYYKGVKKIKPIIAKSYPIASVDSVKKILNLEKATGSDLMGAKMSPKTSDALVRFRF